MILAEQPGWYFWIVSGMLWLLPILFDFALGSRRRRWIRFVLWTLACTALAGLFLKLKMEAPPTERTLILATSGASAEVVDSLMLAYPGATRLSSIDEASKSTWQMTIVVGNGLLTRNWERLSTQEVAYVPAPLPEGILEITVGESAVDEPFNIQGRVHADDTLRLLLISPSGVGKSLGITPEDAAFSWSETIPIAGNWLYQIVGLRGSDTLFREQLPVSVAESAQRNALIVTSTPSFEVNALKNFLVTRQFGVSSKVTLSTNIDQRDYINMDPLPRGNLDSASISRFRLLVFDGSGFMGLSRREKAAVRSAVNYGSVGLLLLTSDAEFVARWGAVRSSGEPQLTEVPWDGSQYELTTNPLKTLGKGWQPVNLGGKVIGQIHATGLGQIAFPAFTDTYLARLQGGAALYDALWTNMLRETIGASYEKAVVDLPALAIIGEPASIHVANPSLPKVTSSELAIPVINSPLRTDWWQAVFWPTAVGWNEVGIDGTTHHLFVHDTAKWMTRRLYSQQQLNRNMVSSPAVVVESPHHRDINPWIFIVIFLLSMSGIWLERKLA